MTEIVHPDCRKREFGEIDAKRAGLVGERRTLAESIWKGGSRALVERLGTVEDEIAAPAQRETALRDELACVETVRIDAAELGVVAETWDALEPGERARVVALLVQRVMFTRGDVEVALR